jgi:hypothetical protein
MASEELTSFVYKFKNLWRHGQEATLNIRSKAGDAWIEPCVGLGLPVDLPPWKMTSFFFNGRQPKSILF